jgi:hypothetical protein
MVNLEQRKGWRTRSKGKRGNGLRTRERIVE